MKKLTIKKILIPLDFSFTSLKALDYAVILAKLSDAEIMLLHVIENIHATSDPFFFTITHSFDYEAALMKLSNENLKQIAEKTIKKGVKKVNIHSTFGRTHQEIIRFSKKIKADMIVVGTHGVSGFREFAMGSNTFRIVHDSKCPVLSIQKVNKAVKFNTILIPFTDHPHSREKVDYALRMAQIYGASLHVLGIDDERTKSHSKKIALEAQQIKSIAEEQNLKCVVKIVQAPYIPKTILGHAAKIKADLIVTIGDEEKQNLLEYFTGSISQQIINHSKIPVMSIHSSFNPKTVDLTFY